MNLKTYELTFECPNGDWHYWNISAPDYQAACESALESVSHFSEDPILKGARLFRIEKMPPRMIKHDNA